MYITTLIHKVTAPYKLSKHRELYEQIAEGYFLTPNRVYKIAHGKSPRSFNESGAYKELLEKGIIIE